MGKSFNLFNRLENVIEWGMCERFLRDVFILKKF